MPSPPPQTRSPLYVSGAVCSGFSWAAGSSSRLLPSQAAEPEETCRPSGAPGAAMATGGTSPKIRSQLDCCKRIAKGCGPPWKNRSEEHTSEIQLLMRISYVVFCLVKKTISLNHRRLTALYRIKHLVLTCKFHTTTTSTI